MGLFGKSKAQKAQDLLQTGSRGVGTVVSVQDTGMTINDNPRVKMNFRVEPIDGTPAFDAQKTTTVSRVMIPRQGDCYPVFYDPAEPGKTWAYATIADDTGRATMTQLFGEHATRFTGMGGAPAAAAPAAAPASEPDQLEQLQKLGELRSQGVLTDAEFEMQKAKLLAGS